MDAKDFYFVDFGENLDLFPYNDCLFNVQASFFPTNAFTKKK